VSPFSEIKFTSNSGDYHREKVCSANCSHLVNLSFWDVGRHGQFESLSGEKYLPERYIKPSLGKFFFLYFASGFSARQWSEASHVNPDEASWRMTSVFQDVVEDDSCATLVICNRLTDFDAFEDYPSSLTGDQSLIGNFCGTLCGNSRSIGSLYGILHVAGLGGRGAPSDDPEAYGRYGENPGKSDRPKGEISNGIVGRLSQKPFLCSCWVES
jgi:hypothetical protein